MKLIMFAGVGAVGKTSVATKIKALDLMHVMDSPVRKVYAEFGISSEAENKALTEKRHKDMQQAILQRYFDNIESYLMNSPAQNTILCERSPYDYLAYQLYTFSGNLTLAEIADMRAYVAAKVGNLYNKYGCELFIIKFPFPAAWTVDTESSDGWRSDNTGKNFVWNAILDGEVNLACQSLDITYDCLLPDSSVHNRTQRILSFVHAKPPRSIPVGSRVRLKATSLRKDYPSHADWVKLYNIPNWKMGDIPVGGLYCRVIHVAPEFAHQPLGESDLLAVSVGSQTFIVSADSVDSVQMFSTPEPNLESIDIQASILANRIDGINFVDPRTGNTSGEYRILNQTPYQVLYKDNELEPYYYQVSWHDLRSVVNLIGAPCHILIGFNGSNVKAWAVKSFEQLGLDVMRDRTELLASNKLIGWLPSLSYAIWR